MNFERPKTYGTDNTPEAHYGSYLEKNEQLVERAHEKAVALIEREAVDPKGFDDIYSSDEIENDLKRVAERTATFQNKERTSLMDKAAVAAEALMYEQVGRCDWLSAEGVKVYPEKTADTDDIFNKTDLVLTFETGEGEEPLAVTVDVTIGMRTLTEKIHSIKQEIDTQTLTTVKYHETPSGEHVPLQKTPRVILGIEPETLVSLLSLWTRGEAADKERLKKHPIQLTLIQEIEAQMEAYEKYARSKKKDAVADRFAKALSVARLVRAEKERHVSQAEEERVVRDIRTALRSRLSDPVARSAQAAPDKDDRQRSEIIRRLRQ